MLCPKCHYIIKARPRTNQQNKAYFGIAVRKLAEASQVSVSAMHKALAGEFLGWDEVKINGKVVKVERSTTDLTTKEFMEYYEKIQRYAAENGIDIKNPGESDDASQSN
jgi:hypothetical protein